MNEALILAFTNSSNIKQIHLISSLNLCVLELFFAFNIKKTNRQIDHNNVLRCSKITY